MSNESFSKSSPKAIYHYLEISAKKFPDKIAIYEKENSISYNNLLINSKHVSNQLQKIIVPGQVVSLFSENSINFLIIYFGTLMAGGIVHLIPSNSSNTQVNTQIKKTNPKIIFCSEILKNKIIKLEYDYFLISDFIRDSSKSEIKYTDIDDKFFPVSSIIFTSGTTGTPKGVKIKHENILFVVKNIIKIIGVETNDIEINPLQLTHSFGLGCIHTIIAQGGSTVIFQNSMNLKTVLDEIIAKKATGFVGVPATFKKLLDQHKQQFCDFGKNLRYLLTNSAPIPKKQIQNILDLLPSTKFFTYYGLTEASRSTFLLFNSKKSKLESVGTPAPGVQIKTIDQFGKNNNPFEIGEIMIKGPNVIDEYLENTDDNSKVTDGWIKTGDLGFFDDENYLFLKGRKDDIINVSGEKVSPSEVELVIKQLIKVDDVCVIGVSDETFGEVPIAFVTPKNKISYDEILIHCIKLLERYKIPQKILFLDSLPINEFGKIEKNVLREMYAKE